MTSKDKVLKKYPEAEAVHRRGLGVTIYAIRMQYYSPMGIGFGLSESKAWVDAAKRIENNVPPERM